MSMGYPMKIKLFAVGLSFSLPLLARAEPLRAIRFNEVRLTDAFWAPRIETNHIATSRHSEGFAPDYDLPNDVAYCETSANGESP
jgi:hypothetical protein